MSIKLIKSLSITISHRSLFRNTHSSYCSNTKIIHLIKIINSMNNFIWEYYYQLINSKRLIKYVIKKQ